MKINELIEGLAKLQSSYRELFKFSPDMSDEKIADHLDRVGHQFDLKVYPIETWRSTYVADELTIGAASSDIESAEFKKKLTDFVRDANEGAKLSKAGFSLHVSGVHAWRQATVTIERS